MDLRLADIVTLAVSSYNQIEAIARNLKIVSRFIFIVDCESDVRFDTIFSTQPVGAHLSIFVHFLNYASEHFQTIPKLRECSLHKKTRKNTTIFCHLAKNGHLRLRKFC